MKFKTLVVLLSIFSGVARIQATTIVVKLEGKRIILAADTRRSFLTVESSAPSGVYDDQCKIAASEKVAVGVTGNVNYNATQNDTVPEWDALDDARDIFHNQSESLESMAGEWQRRAIRHFALYYKANKFRVLDYTKTNRENLLLEGLFVGWGKDAQAKLIIVKVTVDLRVEGNIAGETTSYGVREKPYSSNPLTRQLIEEPIQQAKDAATRWKIESHNIAKSEEGWRYVAFIIKVTADYDHTVGKIVNVLELTPDHSYRWIENNCCPK